MVSGLRLLRRKHNSMKTWLEKDGNNSVYRITEFGHEPEWIGVLILSPNEKPFLYNGGQSNV